jgi:hypothetical protein
VFGLGRPERGTSGLCPRGSRVDRVSPGGERRSTRVGQDDGHAPADRGAHGDIAHPRFPDSRRTLRSQTSHAVLYDDLLRSAHPADRPLQVPLRGTCRLVPPVARVAVVKYTITPLGGAGRPIGTIAAGVVDYLLPGRSQRSPTDRAAPPADGANPDGPARYYADSGEGGRWSGRGAARLGLNGDVRASDFAKVLAGRPR